MRVVIIAALAACLGGCVPDFIIRDRAIEQNVTIEDVTNAILVANILRARDQAPLHFADIPLMHESFQIAGGVTSTILFGPVHAGSPSNTIAPTISMQEAPTFDLNNLDAQDFITGVMSPVKPTVVKYWLDRGLDDRIALLLFFSSVTITVDKEEDKDKGKDEDKDNDKDKVVKSLTILNDPRRVIEPSSNPDQPGLPAYLAVINSITGQFKVIEAPDLTPVGPPFPLETDKDIKALSKIDAAKYEVDPLEEKCKDKESKDKEKCKDEDKNKNKGNPAKIKAPQYKIVEEPEVGVVYPRYQLFAVSDKKLLICFDSLRASARSAADRKSCKEAGGAPAGNKTVAPPNPNTPCKDARDFLLPLKDPKEGCSATLKFALRSAGDVVHFLGDLVWLQENMKPHEPLNNPITLKYCAPGDSGCSDGGALFRIARETEGKPGRLRVPYRGDYYTVPNAASDDHTLQVLAITSQLINLNKSAKELRSTPTVQIVP